MWGQNKKLTGTNASEESSYYESGKEGDSTCALEISVVDAGCVDSPPDGGKAWLVVLGGSLALFASFGIANCYGVFQSYYAEELLRTSSSSAISLIGSTQLFLIYGLGPIIGRIVDAYGAKVVMPLGTAIVFTSLMLLSFCQQDQFYQAFLTHGILFGIGSSLVFTPSLTCIGQHFTRTRAFAISIAGAVCSLAGALYPILLQHLFGTLGFPWTVRILAFTTIPLLAISCLTVKAWVKPTQDLSLRTAIDLNGFKDLRYSLAAAGSCLVFLVLFIPFFYIQTYGIVHGVPPSVIKYLVTIINTSGIPPRLISGRLADRFGVLPIMVPSLLISGCLVLGVWMTAKGTVQIVLFTCLYGLFAGGFTTLLPPYIATLVPRENFGARLGSVYIGVAIANLVGPTVAGTFVHNTSSITQAEFNKLILFTGVSMCAGALLCGIAHFVGIKYRHSTNTTT